MSYDKCDREYFSALITDAIFFNPFGKYSDLIINLLIQPLHRTAPISILVTNLLIHKLLNPA